MYMNASSHSKKAGLENVVASLFPGQIFQATSIRVQVKDQTVTKVTRPVYKEVNHALRRWNFTRAQSVLMVASVSVRCHSLETAAGCLELSHPFCVYRG